MDITKIPSFFRHNNGCDTITEGLFIAPCIYSYMIDKLTLENIFMDLNINFIKDEKKYISSLEDLINNILIENNVNMIEVFLLKLKKNRMYRCLTTIYCLIYRFCNINVIRYLHLTKMDPFIFGSGDKQIICYIAERTDDDVEIADCVIDYGLKMIGRNNLKPILDDLISIADKCGNHKMAQHLKKYQNE
jgi:hypothetical protein